MAKRGFLQWDEFDVYEIMKELDEQTGMSFRFLDIDIDEKLVNDNALAYCTSHGMDINNYLELVHDEMSKTDDVEKCEIFSEMIDKIGDAINEYGKFKIYKPVNFKFSPQALNLPYDMFREIVIHEYAHAVVNVECFLDFKPTEDDAHGEMFQDTVKRLGGTFTGAYAIDDRKTSRKIKTVYERADELGWQYVKPYTVHYVTDAGNMLFTMRRKTRCKAIKECASWLKIDDVEVVSVHEVDKAVGKDIVVVVKFDVYDKVCKQILQ